MLWAKRFRDEHQILLQRIDSKAESSALVPVTEEMKNLVATTEQWRQDKEVLLRRIDLKAEFLALTPLAKQVQNLAATTEDRQREKELFFQRIDSKAESSALVTLAEEIHKLRRTVERLQKDNDALRDQMQHLEQDISYREQDVDEKFQELGRTIAEIQEDLSQRIEGVQIMKGKEIFSYQKQVRRISSRSQRAATKIIYRTRAGEDSTHSSPMSLYLPAPLTLSALSVPSMHASLNLYTVSKALSQATTTDDNSLLGTGTRSRCISRRTESVGYQMIAGGKIIEDSRDSPATNQYPAYEAIGLSPQGEKTLEEYFRDGAHSVARAMELYETRATKAFVCGIRDQMHRTDLWDRVAEQGWTYQQLRKEMQRILEGEGKGKKRRKRGKMSLEL